jgi:hypothetical protein
MMKLAIIHAPPDRKFSAWLTKVFTGSTAYHCGFVCEQSGTFYDMNLLPRKMPWPRYDPPKWVELHDVSKLTREDCEEFLKQDSTITYGWVDYLLFALRPVYHLFGKSTRNASGMICSEMCALWLERVGYHMPFKAVPSPRDLEDWAMAGYACATSDVRVMEGS